jgi:hypothetical protein
MHEALCRPSSTTLDIVHAEGGPPITQRTSGLDPEVASKIGEETKYPHCLDPNKAPVSAAIKSLPDFDPSGTLSKFIFADYAYLEANRQAWETEWTKIKLGG